MRQLKISKSITNRDSDSIEKYLQEIGKKPILTTEQEVILAQRIKQGDQEALEKLVCANLRFVVSVAKQYQNSGMSLNDLISVGNHGLIKAAQKFDETKGFKFISYAVWWIRQKILQELAENLKLIRLPLNKIGTTGKIKQVVQELEQQLEYPPDIQQIADIVGISEQEAIELFRISKIDCLDAPVSTDSSEEGSNLIDFITEDDDSVQEKYYKEDFYKEIYLVFSILKTVEKNVLIKFFGLDGNHPLTLEEVGLSLDPVLTRERVRQIKEKALEKINKSEKAKKILFKYLG
jgi:RNA polymerase primary sigma factor